MSDRRKPGTRRTLPPAVPSPAAAPRGGAIAVALARSVAALALLATVPACQPATDRTAPDEIVGVWTTSEPRYADRFFEIARDSITIGIGEGRSQIHRIIGVVRAREEMSTLYIISYTNADGEPDALSLYFDGTEGAVIRLKNQKQIPWTKRKR